MSNENRKIVQEGLDRKATERKRRMNDAAHDAAERQLHTECNRRTQEYWEKESREEAAAAAQAKRREEYLVKEALKDEVWHSYLMRTFRNFITAAVFGFLYAIGGTAFWLTMGGIGISILWILTDSVAAFNRYRKECAR